MRSNRVRGMYGLLALAAFGCAGAQVTQQSSAAPISAGPPTAVVVYPFAVDASDVSLNSASFRWLTEICPEKIRVPSNFS